MSTRVKTSTDVKVSNHVCIPKQKVPPSDQRAKGVKGQCIRGLRNEKKNNGPNGPVTKWPRAERANGCRCGRHAGQTCSYFPRVFLVRVDVKQTACCHNKQFALFCSPHVRRPEMEQKRRTAESTLAFVMPSLPMLLPLSQRPRSLSPQVALHFVVRDPTRKSR